MKAECQHCFGKGWYEDFSSGHVCNGDEEMCAAACPAPIPVQVQCSKCQGSGLVEMDPLAGLASGMMKHSQ